MVLIGSTGILSPGKFRWLRALGWMVALTVAIVIVFNAAARSTLVLLGGGGGEASAGTKLAAACVGSLVILLLYRLAVGVGERRAVPELALRKAPLDLAAGVAVGAGIIALIVGTLGIFGWVVIEPRAIDGVALAVRDAIRSGVLEEVVLRLVILRLLWRAFGIGPAIMLASILFGALHLGNPDSSLFAAACLIAGEGIGVGLYLITGRIWASIGMHAAWNFAQGWLFGAAVSGTDGFAGGPLVLRPTPGVSDVLSGGGFGPEASLAAMLVSLLASAAILMAAWKSGSFVAADQPASGKDATAS